MSDLKYLKSQISVTMRLWTNKKPGHKKVTLSGPRTPRFRDHLFDMEKVLTRHGYGGCWEQTLVDGQPVPQYHSFPL